jgi:DNA-binding transcriptional ArsR family regulator
MSLEKLVASLGHPLGRRILRYYEDGGRPATPEQLAEALGLPLPDVEYHVVLLAEGGVLRQTESHEQTGYFYDLALRGDNEWVRTILEASRESDGDR